MAAWKCIQTSRAVNTGLDSHGTVLTLFKWEFGTFRYKSVEPLSTYEQDNSTAESFTEGIKIPHANYSKTSNEQLRLLGHKDVGNPHRNNIQGVMNIQHTKAGISLTPMLYFLTFLLSLEVIVRVC
jgi:hypothetical protein